MARRQTRARRRRSPVPRILAVCALLLAIFLYYRPVQSYVHARSQVHSRQVEVALLRAQHLALRRQLKRGASDAALERQARRLGFVKSGEKLYIVTGIDSWRAAQMRQRRH